MARHVFFDNSNIYGGAQRAAESLESGAIWMSVRIHYRSIFRLIGADQAATRVLAGSVPPGNEALWEAAREEKFNTDLLQRVARDDGSLGEQAVDEMLHLKIANALLDHKPPQTLVIASGDGAASKFGTSFVGQAERALKCEWNVEVWSWDAQLTKKYDKLCRDYSGQITVWKLDPHYKSITFLKGGSYIINGCTIAVQDRVVHPLKIVTTVKAA